MSMLAIRRSAVATLLATITATAGGPFLTGTAAAQDDDCATRLMLVPIEATVVPAGWAWEMLILGYPLGIPGWVGAVTTTDEEDDASASLDAGLLARCLSRHVTERRGPGGTAGCGGHRGAADRRRVVGVARS